MSEVTFKVTGFKAFLLLLALIGFVGFRFLSARSSIETDAAEEIATWVQAEYTSRYMADNPEPDEETAAEILALTKIEFSEITGRGTPDDMVVRVRIRVDGSAPRYGNEVRYFRMEYSMVTGWIYQREVSKLSYYLNFF